MDVMRKGIRQPIGLSRDIALDLGTASVRGAVRGRGLLPPEPSLAAVDRQTGDILQVGQAARNLLESTPDKALPLRPVQNGAVCDSTVAQALLRSLLKKAFPKAGRKPRLLLGIPTGLTPAERQVLVETALQAGAGKVCLMESPLAALAGSAGDITRPEGSMVTNIGAGTTDIALLSLGKIVSSLCLRTGGNDLDKALIRYTCRKYGVLLGLHTAEQTKLRIGQVYPDESVEELSVKGRCLSTGLPGEITLTSNDCVEAFSPLIDSMLDGIRQVLEQTPAELKDDLREHGILLTGGGSLLRGLDSLIQKSTGIRTESASDPLNASILGLEQMLPTLSARQADSHTKPKA